jgi:hypothetical protein
MTRKLYAWDRQSLPVALPSNRLRGKFIAADRLPVEVRGIAERELDRAAKAPGWNPKIIRLRHALHMIDVCADGRTGELHSVRVVLLQDHPFLRVLESLGNAPRIVKTLYRKETRMAHERALEVWDGLRAWERAWESWAKYMGARIK